MDETLQSYLKSLYENTIKIATNKLREFVVLDFTQDFKKQYPKIKSLKNNEKNEEDIKVYKIPCNIKITEAEVKYRKCLDVRRWMCMSRPQYSKSCGLTSVVSCWNYLYSTLGTGLLPPIPQEEAMTVLGFNPPFGKIKFGPSTGNTTLLKWFRVLNRHYRVKGEASFLWKAAGNFATPDIDEKKALSLLEDGLRTDTSAFIYHCYNHYCCPIGFEITSDQPTEAYKPLTQFSSGEEHWIIIAEPSKGYPVFHVKKWSEIVKDISTKYPEYYNIRKPKKGIMRFKEAAYVTGKMAGCNPHCIMIFKKL